MKYLFQSLCLIILFTSCQDVQEYDLVLTNATILDVGTGKQNLNKTICVKDGLIIKIADAKTQYIATKIIDANHKLVTPTFIDAHIHPISEFADGNYDLVPDTIPPDSSAYYREDITDGYLPYGTSTVLMMGHPDSWTDQFIQWTNNPQPNHVDVFTCGGALATEDGHTYKGHHRVANPAEARQKIIDYHQKGLKHLKLYWRLKAPEFKSIIHTADSLSIQTFAHSGGFFDPTQMTVFQALDLGIKNFEHVAILPCSVFNSDDWAIIHEQFQTHFGNVEGAPDHVSLLYILETFKHVNDYKKEDLIRLINTMAENDCTISTTIGWIYKTYHETFFGPARIKLNKEQFNRCHNNFGVMMEYLKLIHEKNIPLRIASDTNPGGQIVLLEIMLMVEYGLSMEDAIKIATINGAAAMNIDEHVGSVEEEKHANLIIWDYNPFDDYKNIKESITIIKDGIIYNMN